MKIIVVSLLSLLLATSNVFANGHQELTESSQQLVLAIETIESILPEMTFRTEGGEIEFLESLNVMRTSLEYMNVMVLDSSTITRDKIMTVTSVLYASYNVFKTLLFLDEMQYEDYRLERVFSNAHFYELRTVTILKNYLAQTSH